MRLHIGCFDRPVDGWINTDVTPHMWIARTPGLAPVLHRLGLLSDERSRQHRAGVFRKIRYLDVSKRFPFAEGTFEAVFSSHVLEHLYPGDAQRCLAETFRTLKPGGVCRVVVPDLDRIVAGYRSDDPAPFLRAIFETDRRAKNAHHWGYSETSLLALLRTVGFRDGRRRSFREGHCPDLALLDNRPDGSLFVEAVK